MTICECGYRASGAVCNACCSVKIFTSEEGRKEGAKFGESGAVNVLGVEKVGRSAFVDDV